MHRTFSSVWIHSMQPVPELQPWRTPCVYWHLFNNLDLDKYTDVLIFDLTWQNLWNIANSSEDIIDHAEYFSFSNDVLSHHCVRPYFNNNWNHPHDPDQLLLKFSTIECLAWYNTHTHGCIGLLCWIVICVGNLTMTTKSLPKYRC